jgi:hypothetical protein
MNCGRLVGVLGTRGRRGTEVRSPKGPRKADVNIYQMNLTGMSAPGRPIGNGAVADPSEAAKISKPSSN